VTDAGPIVCGIDFSPSSSHALRCAAVLAVRLGRPLRLVSAVEPLLSEAAKLQRRSGEFMQQVRRDLESEGATLALPADAVTTYVEAGEPAPVLMAAAESARASLIVLGTRGIGRAARFFLGSTTTRLLRATDRPVLAVPGIDDDIQPPEWAPFTRIVCGVDFSEGSIAAAESAAALAQGLGAELLLVHAVPPPAIPVIWEQLVVQADDERVAHAEGRLREVAGRTGQDARVLARVGTPEGVLTDAAGTSGVIIVVGLRGAGYHRPGSTAMRILASANVPVLAVPE
jgi:nucleotide-binding universal stress UspA family protein